jgi:LPXTG-motif cell wall-anchored protein
MKRWLGTAGLGGLTIMGAFAFPDAAAAAPGGKPGAPPGGPAAPAAPAAKAKQAASPAAAAPKANGTAATKANGQANGQAKASGQANGQAKANPKPGKGNPNPGKGNPGRGNPNPGKGNPAVDAVQAAPAAAPAAAAVAAAPSVVAARVVQVTICHATSSETSPFELITIASPAGQAHLAHGDIAPVNGVCPGAITPPAPGEPVTICHRTSSDTNPFEVITIPDAALPAHLAHGDVATVGGDCPGQVVLPEVIVPPVTPGPGTQGPGTLVLGARFLGAQRSAELDTVQARSFSEVVPVARAVERVTGKAGGERRGTLPATGTEVGALALLGLLLLLAGARLTRNGKVRTAMASQPTSQPVVPGSQMAASPVSRSSLRAKAPPTLLRRRE